MDVFFEKYGSLIFIGGFILFVIFSNEESLEEKTIQNTIPESSYRSELDESSSISSEPSYEPTTVYYGETPTFNGYECTDDCSGHEAGYNWAEENGVTSVDDCGGNSNSFIEGCESYAEEQADSVY